MTNIGGILSRFRLDGKVAVITGGAGLLGMQHASAVAEAGGIPVLWDIKSSSAAKHAKEIFAEFGCPSVAMSVDITNKTQVKSALDRVVNEFRRVDILINNAANDPKVIKGAQNMHDRFENFDLESWNRDIAVGLTGAFLCSQIIGTYMATHKGGIILNIGSDLSLISPDQRIYRRSGVSEDKQHYKPVSYSVVKHGVIGLTKYSATYWAKKNVRVNAICPGGVYNNQPAEFVDKLVKLIPLGRMANLDEYKSAILFLCSDASSYMTGACLIMDGGRTVW